MWQVSWSATSADSFMELAYGPNGGETNFRFSGTRNTTTSFAKAVG
jgi:hypothetical protein